jgi:hypothetical protein
VKRGEKMNLKSLFNKDLGRKDILKKSDLRRIRVKVSEWGGYVYIQEMNAKQFSEYFRIFDGIKPNEDVSMRVAKILTFVLCDKNGNLLYGEDDVEVLSKKSPSALTKIFNIGLSMSGLTIDALKKNVDGLKKTKKNSSL